MAAVYPHKHQTDIHEWHKMGEAGVFNHRAVELIEGEILDKPPITVNHAGHLKRLSHYFYSLIVNKAIISIKNPVQLNRFSEPEPDLMLLKPCEDFYSSRYPTADNVLLLIEISDTTLNFDQTQKLRLYAKHQIPEYWILNLNHICLEIYREPFGELYKEKRTLHTGELNLLQLPDVTISILAIL